MALKSPERDLERIKSKYQISTTGTGNLSSLVFGPAVKKYIEKASSIYSMAKPFLNTGKDEPPKPKRGKGVDVKFREFNPAPTFWARRVKADVLLSSIPINGVIKDLSSDQTLTGKPTTFNLSGEGMEKAKSIEINGH